MECPCEKYGERVAIMIESGVKYAETEASADVCKGCDMSGAQYQRGGKNATVR